MLCSFPSSCTLTNSPQTKQTQERALPQGSPSEHLGLLRAAPIPSVLTSRTSSPPLTPEAARAGVGDDGGPRGSCSRLRHECLELLGDRGREGGGY